VKLPRRLQLGAFDQVHDGWLSTDVTPHLLVARVPGLAGVLHRLGVVSDERLASHRSGAFADVRYLDLTRPFRFPDDTFECVFASHVLEHLDPGDAERCLREVHRTLARGGILRLAVPDLDTTIAEYDPEHPEVFLDGIYQGRSRRRDLPHRHWWHYNARSLGELLTRVGFVEIDFPQYRCGRLPDVQRVDNRPGSLFAEARKP
jgi:SAM-dependent methyltransferase